MFVDWAARRTQATGLADLLLYSSTVAPSTIELYDGALQTTFAYRGADLGSADLDALTTLSHQLAETLRLGSNWMIEVDATRRSVVGHPPCRHDVHPVLRAIDHSRGSHFNRHGNHFSTDYYLTVTYLPPPQSVQKVVSWFAGDKRADTSDAELRRIALRRLEHFETIVDNLATGLRVRFVHLERLGLVDRGDFHDDMQLRFLRECVTGEDLPFAAPRPPIYLNLLFRGEIEPAGSFRMCGKHVRVVSLDTYPIGSRPRIFSDFECFPFPCRWSTRMILFDPEVSRAMHKRNVSEWRANRRGLFSTLAGREGSTDGHALNMAGDAMRAMDVASAGDVQFGAFKQRVILRANTAAEVTEQVKAVKKHYKNCGFGARLEGRQTQEALRGTWPGHAYSDVRQAIGVHTLHLAHMMPLSTPWQGEEWNPSQYMPHKSPPMFMAITDGKTPVRFHHTVGDVPHGLILSPTGGGKSTLLAHMAAQFLARFPKAQVIGFDKKASQKTLCRAVGGTFLDLGAADCPSIYPLHHLETPADRNWAESWLGTIAESNNFRLKPDHHNYVTQAIRTLAGRPESQRTMSDLLPQLQRRELQDAFRYYTVDGTASLLDGNRDPLDIRGTRYLLFEMDRVLPPAMDPRVLGALMPVLFRRIEKRLDGSPTLILIDEAWVIDRPAFAEALRSWLKECRRLNAGVWLATQGLDDVLATPLKHVVLDQCKIQVFPPNASATGSAYDHYHAHLELTDEQIRQVAAGRPQRDYYLRQGGHWRRIELEITTCELAFVGANSQEEQADFGHIMNLDPERGPANWLRHRNLPEWAEYLESISQEETLAQAV